MTVDGKDFMNSNLEWSAILFDFYRRWLLPFGAVFLFVSFTLSAGAANVSTIEKTYPGLAAGVLKSARLEKLSSGKLLSADGFEILQTWVDETIHGIPAEMRKEAERGLFFLLEQEVTRRVILRDAKAAGVPMKDLTEDQVIQSYLSQKVDRITVSDREAKSFYDANKELVGGLPFDQVKESIHAFLVQQKQQDAVSDYVKNLENLKDIQINAEWVKKQHVLAMDNPVDRARRSGKPSMVEFGATGCVPCDMMQPILDKLKKTHGQRLNVVFVNVRENQILGARFGIRSIPVQDFYDRSGKETFRHVGFFAEAEVNKQLIQLGLN